MNKNLLIGLGVFIAVIVVGFYFVGNARPNLKNQNTTVQSPSATISPNAPVKEFKVSAKEFSFSPSTISVKKGDVVKITFTNDGTTSHNFTIGNLGVSTNTINPGSSDSVEFTADKSGSFDFFCSVDSHESFGMKGTLEVK